MINFIKSKASYLLVITFALLTGCQTINDVISAKESGREGLSVVYSVSYEKGWDIAKRVLRWEGVDAIEEHKDEGYMLTTTGMSIGTAGTVIGVWVDKTPNDAQVKVTIVTKRRIATNLITSLTEGTFQKVYAQAVDIVKSGKPLPATRPEQK
jgi:hypothetical protein